MMLKLIVTIIFANGEKTKCGEIFTTLPDSRGKIQGSFRYANAYIDHPLGFSLDPRHLPLGPDEYFTDRSQGVHGVFEDALPDDWGRALLARKNKLPRKDQIIPKLLEALGSNGLGALGFYTEKEPAYHDRSADIHTLDLLLDSAMDYDAGLPIDNERLQALFSCGSSPGGARPKALVKDDSGGLWIAKFPKLTDKYNVESIEAATLHLARNSALNIPDFKLQRAGQKKVLLVKRFDITHQGGRYHMISMQTLLDADGYYHLSYSNIFKILMNHSSDPERDCELLFRQMVFNAAVGNTDDHLKNFSMLHTKYGYRLSPAYDLLPDINENREHRLSFPQESGTLTPGRKMLEHIGKKFKISQPGIIISHIYEQISRFQTVFQQYKVPEKDIQRLESGIHRNINKS